MTIEEELFKKTSVDFNKILKYGFKKDKDCYKYSKNIMNNRFRVDVLISKVFDLAFNEEYTNFRVEENKGSFISQIKEEFLNLLKDIKDNCFIKKDFIYEQTNRIANAINQKYGDKPEFEWEKFQGYATFKNKESKKWYGLIMNIDNNKLDKKLNGEVEIINLKLEPSEIENLLKMDGFYPAYHMNKKSWISIILNDTISDEEILKLVKKSYSYTIINRKKILLL